MSRRHIRVVGAMLEKQGGRYLITQRPPTASLPLLWEFPGGRVQEGESDPQALARELMEEMGIDVEVLEEVMHTQHEYPHYDIDFRVYRCRLRSPESAIKHLRVHDHRWVTLSEMSQYKFPDADARTLEKLLDLDH
ncbi:MAG: (deoxy)nucleoside triphosphate pyrophosphohydrolase [Myxococcales bacterium]|nr:(deoxy)nucleoside triphosphate pyrophosphohydrolase [Myxococcales bacterium]